MRSRRCSGPGWPSGETKASGRRVTRKAPFLAHVEGGSGRSEASPTAILQDTHSVEVEFCELRLLGILGSSCSYRGALQRKEGYVVLLLPALPSEGAKLIHQILHQ